jgi:hypothetical protein
MKLGALVSIFFSIGAALAAGRKASALPNGEMKGS